MKFPLLPFAGMLCLFFGLASLPVRAAEPELVFSVKTWEGEYRSEDIPGGVKSTPALGAIYTMGADGTGLKQIIAPALLSDYPTISPDGQWIYFQSKRTGHHEVYRCKRDGTETASVTPVDKLNEQLKSAASPFVIKDAYGYDFSQDGTRMVFTVHDGASGRVVLAKSDGSSPSYIAPGRGYIYMARLDPTNERVVYSGPARGYRLQLAKLPDGEPVELTPDHPESFVPQFTPDGKTIVFTRRDGNVYRIGTDGKNLKRLTEANNYVEFRLSPKDTHGSTDGPDISPDGKKIAFISRKAGVPNVFTMNVDGTDQRQITSRTTPCGRVRFSPDSQQIAFVSFEGKYPQLFTVAATGGEPRQLTRLDGGVYFVKWAPAANIKTGNSPSAKRPAATKALPLPGEVFSVEGKTAFLIPAKNNTAAKNKPWIWYAPTLPNLPGREERWMFEQFLESGIAIAGIDAGESYGSPDGNKVFSALHQEMTQVRGYSQKPVFLGRSRGGLQTLSWAAANPSKAGAFTGIYPVCNLASYPGIKKAAPAYALSPADLESRLAEFNPLDRLEGLAKAKVPLFAIHGDVDTVVPLEVNSGAVKERYEALGGKMQLIIPKGQGHNMWTGFFQCQELVDFAKAQALKKD